MASGTQKECNHHVLVLGAGLISAPAIGYLLRDGEIQVTVASMFKQDLDALAARFSDIKVFELDIQKSPEKARKLIDDNDLVISLLPYIYHPSVIKMCIERKTNLVTASYITPDVMLHDEAVREAGMTMLFEMGLDPGIDHMLALKCINDVKQRGGEVTSFVSLCGGLPAPDCSENPLRYKFSWSPLGALMNLACRGAIYRRDDDIIEFSDGFQILDGCESYDFLPGVDLEGMANGNSLHYASLYGIETASTVYRGTLRYKGFCVVAKALLDLRLISREERDFLQKGAPRITWKGVVCALLGIQRDVNVDSLKTQLMERFHWSKQTTGKIEQLGLLDDSDMIDVEGSPLATLSKYLSERLAYGQGERDVVILRLEIGVKLQNGETEQHVVELEHYGVPNGGCSAMSQTAGLPVGVAAKMLLNGEIQRTGIVGPFSGDIYTPMLAKIEEEGIVARHVIK